MTEEKIELWTIYNKPPDYPCKYVARRFIMDKPTEDILIADTLTEIRKLIPNNTYNLGRHPFDKTCIEEVWMVV